MKQLLLIAVLVMSFVASAQKFAEPVVTDSVAALDPHEIIVRDASSRENLFIVISKRDLNLRVYQALKGDTTLVAQFPACLSKNKGNKQRRGDMRTPESPAGKPFRITQIQDASSWRHDFGDGRGNIKAYGHWFLRLATPGHSGIGIHGSTNNESSVPGRASEGCIRLRDQDIITLKERYARVGMPVIIKTEDQGLYPWEESLR